jgi:hypothetical protein
MTPKTASQYAEELLQKNREHIKNSFGTCTDCAYNDIEDLEREIPALKAAEEEERQRTVFELDQPGWWCPWLKEKPTFVVGGIAHTECCGHRIEDHQRAVQRTTVQLQS